VERSAEFVSGQPVDALSETDKKVLDFAKTAPSHPGVLNERLRSDLDISTPRYYQILQRLTIPTLDSRGNNTNTSVDLATAHAPDVVSRYQDKAADGRARIGARREGNEI